jgi:signal transduction histidine kinase
MTRLRTTAPRAALVALALCGSLVGALSFAFARTGPAYAFAGDSLARAIVELAAGYALIAVGIVSWLRRPESRFGVLLGLAGIGWLLAEWNNPDIGSSVAFTVGLISYAVAPALVGHAALSYPDGRLTSGSDRLGVALAYLGALLVLGLAPAVLFDPPAAGCAQCPQNLLLVHGSPGAVEDLTRLGLYLGLIWSPGLAVLLVVRLARSATVLRWLIWPVIVAATAYLGLVAADFAHGVDRGFLSNDQTDIDLRLAQAAALLMLSLGVSWSWVRARQKRAELARLVIELSRSPAPGGLRDALAESLGDPSLGLAYRLADGRLVDGRGRDVAVHGEVTSLVRDRQEVALLSHRAGLLDDQGLVGEVAGAAQLALLNERLRAESGAQLEDLRASRARVIATGDAERRRLERDLHDGAQQQLVGLTLSLRLARSKLGRDPDQALVARIDEADAELRTAIAELRELANGIFPAVLADEGLAAGVEALVEDATLPIEIARLPEKRFGGTAEAAAYFVVSETIQRGAHGRLRIAVAPDHGVLVIEIEADRGPDDLTEIEDRVGALDGTVELVRGPGGRVTVRAEIPCAS